MLIVFNRNENICMHTRAWAAFLPFLELTLKYLMNKSFPHFFLFCFLFFFPPPAPCMENDNSTRVEYTTNRLASLILLVASSNL